MIFRIKLSRLLTVAVGALGLVLAVQIANATHPRPSGATPIRVSLVPAYEQCTSPNSQHGTPLAFPSCSPPLQASDWVTIGTGDANGAAANSVGSVRISVVVGTPGPPEDSDVLFQGSITDVRCKPGVTTCGNANTAGGADYTGELQGNATIRITDHYNGPNRDQAGTVTDLPLPFQLSCASTADPAIGSTCAIPPPSCLGCPPPKEGVRTVIEMTQLQIRDGGADGLVATTQGNTLFMVQGLFLP